MIPLKDDNPTSSKPVVTYFLISICVVVFLIESISKLFNLKEPATTIYSIGILSKSFSLNIDRAREILKYHPKQSIDEAIDEFILWYKKNNN